MPNYCIKLVQLLWSKVDDIGLDCRFAEGKS